MILSIEDVEEVSEPQSYLLSERRLQIQQLARLSEFLPQPHDRMAQAILVDGRTLTWVANRLGMDWMAAKRLYRRLIRRVNSPAFQRVVRHFDRLDPAEQSLARLAVLAGQSLRRVAMGLGTTVHTVRKQLPGLLAKLARLDQDCRVADEED